MQRPLNIKKIGLLGGSSHVATVEYYKFLNHEFNARKGGSDIAETLIAGMNFGNIEYFVQNNLWKDLEKYVESNIISLISGGSDVIICVSNTLHKVAEPLAAKHNIPFIHIVDSTAKEISKRTLTKVALFGTKPVMTMNYIKDRYKEFNIEIVAPPLGEQIEINNIIFNELCKGRFLSSSKNRYLEIADGLFQKEGAQGLILGCTEIFLLINQNDRPDIPFFNTAYLHCLDAINYVLS